MCTEMLDCSSSWGQRGLWLHNCCFSPTFYLVRKAIFKWLYDQPNDEFAWFPSKVAKNIYIFDQVIKLSLIIAPLPTPTFMSALIWYIWGDFASHFGDISKILSLHLLSVVCWSQLVYVSTIHIEG